MGRYYGLKIRSGEMTLEQVPKLWKKVTEKWLKENQRKVSEVNEVGKI